MSDRPDVPAHRYDGRVADEIETRWQATWDADGTYHAPNPSGPLADGFDAMQGKPKTFVLDMFPYPSGDGLHVGHPLGFIGTDVYARYLRMTGHNVLHTMGFDAFGLPAEQYAVQTGQHPRITTEANVANYRRQLHRLGLGHDPRRSVSTTDVTYYRWTQWIFLQIFNSWYDRAVDRARPIDELIQEFETGVRDTPDGRDWATLDSVERREVVDSFRLAYLDEAPVNWCPGLGTVLANEEVTSDGRSDRGNFPVFKRPLKQWKMRITAYADRLIDDLDVLDWPEPIKRIQRNWIGRSEGALIHFPAPSIGESISVFTTRPDTMFGATYMVLAPEHPLVDVLLPATWPEGTPPKWTGGAATPFDAFAGYLRTTGSLSDLERQVDSRQKTGVFTGAYATNPATRAPIPVFVADYVLMGYGTGAIMAVPGQDERDWEFAEVFDLPIVRTVQPSEGWEGKAYVGDGPAINSGFLDGLGVADAKRKIIDWLEAQALGEGTITYRLRDWLFSRQRYWGEPFPIIYDDTGLPIAVPESMLPVLLPEVEDFSPRTFADDDETSMPEPPLARGTTGSRSSSISATEPAPIGERRTRCRSGLARVGTSCAISTRRTRTPSSTRRSSATGWVPSAKATRAASTSTWVVSSTRCCTCCTRASGTRCCSTSATRRRSSHTDVCTTRATSSRPHIKMRVACTSMPPRCKSARGATTSMESR